MPSIEEIAESIGFSEYALIDAADVITSKELREGCNAQACRKYGSCWTCPPAAGTFDELQPNIRTKRAGVLVQTIRDNIDYYEDWEALAETRDLHNEKLDQLANELRATQTGVLEFSTGGCDVCGTCTYPDAPCRKPAEQRLSLSAHGVAVGSTCKKAGLDYSFQNGRVRFVGMVLFD